MSPDRRHRHGLPDEARAVAMAAIIGVESACGHGEAHVPHDAFEAAAEATWTPLATQTPAVTAGLPPGPGGAQGRLLRCLRRQIEQGHYDHACPV